MKRKFAFTCRAIILAILLGNCTAGNLNSPNNDLVTDIDGNTYHTVKIGKQIWMAENLRVTRYSNGDPIPYVTGKAQWSSLTEEAYCNYNNDTGILPAYGRLYNWWAIADKRNIAPKGWHVPSEKDFDYLTKELGGILVAGGKLKGAKAKYWKQSSLKATDESKFSSVPGGYRNGDYGTFHLQNTNCFLWTASGSADSAAWMRMLSYDHTEIFRSEAFKTNGFSIRCVKD